MNISPISIPLFNQRCNSGIKNSGFNQRISFQGNGDTFGSKRCADQGTQSDAKLTPEEKLELLTGTCKNPSNPNADKLTPEEKLALLKTLIEQGAQSGAEPTPEEKLALLEGVDIDKSVYDTLVQRIAKEMSKGPGDKTLFCDLINKACEGLSSEHKLEMLKGIIERKDDENLLSVLTIAAKPSSLSPEDRVKIITETKQ